MGTRADFYVGRGPAAEWLGSIAWDGYPDGVFDEAPHLFADPGVDAWREWVARFLAARKDATMPAQGWPWPWRDSQTTDYAYAWDSGVIYGSSFGHRWFRIDPAAAYYGEDHDDASDKSAAFPDMTERKAVTYGERSGALIVVFGDGGRP